MASASTKNPSELIGCRAMIVVALAALGITLASVLVSIA
jgi:hypothetical protein